MDLEDQETEFHSISHPSPGPGKHSQAVLTFLLHVSHDIASPY